MKKAISFILVLALCLGLCACGSSGGPEKPTEPEEWVISTRYVAGKVAEFMTTEDYRKMVSDFETSYHDVNGKLVVRKPYVDAAIEYYMAEPACHLLILLVRGDFCWNGSYTDMMKIVYDIDTGNFYDGLVGYGNGLDSRYPGISGTAIESLLFRPNEIYTTALGSEPLHTQYEVYHALNAEELDAVNKALGVEEPQEGIVYEPLPTEETPVEVPDEVPDEVPAETSADESANGIPAEEVPATLGGAATVSEQTLADAARNFLSTRRYQEIASDPGSIRISAAFEYSLADFSGHDVHVLVIRVEGVDTDMWGFCADTFLVDMHTGNLWHEGNLDVNNWGNFTAVEECFAAIICTPVWEQDRIWSEDEIRTDLPQSMIDAVNHTLS